MSNVGDPAVWAHAVAASDTVNDPNGPYRSIYVGVSGNIAVITVGGSTAIFNNVPVGVLPVQVQRVLATGTTATGLMGLK